MPIRLLAVHGAYLVVLANATLETAATADRTERVTKVQNSRPVAPIAEGRALASSPASVAGVLVRGVRTVDFLTLAGASGLQQTFDRFDEGKAIAIGRKLADQLALRAGDNITLVASGGPMAAGTAAPRARIYNVGIVLETGMADHDFPVVFMSYAEALAFLGR